MASGEVAKEQLTSENIALIILVLLWDTIETGVFDVLPKVRRKSKR
jgi:hypothetical protein